MPEKYLSLISSGRNLPAHSTHFASRNSSPAQACQADWALSRLCTSFVAIAGTKEFHFKRPAMSRKCIRKCPNPNWDTILYTDNFGHALEIL